MPILLIRKSVFALFLLVAFQLLAIQISYSSEKRSGDVSGLEKQAVDLQTMGYYGKAIPVMKEVLALRKSALGGSNDGVARCLT